MLFAVTGRPGEGKSCFAVQHLILKELAEGSRPIYTNIWLHRGRISKYFKNLGLKPDLKRLHYLEEHQIRRFWTYGEKNALMVLDEVGEFFNANAWKELSSDPQWDPASYARLHRKVGHETYLIVQDLNHIYKQYRDLIGVHIQLVNCAYRKLLGFSGPKIFIAKHFDQIAPRKCVESHVYKFDKKIFDLYDTTQVYEVNSGVKTNESKKYKETKVKKQGFLIRFLKKFFTYIGKRFFGIGIVVAIVVLLYGLFNAPRLLTGLGEKSLTKAKTDEENTNNSNDTVSKSIGAIKSTFKRTQQPTTVGSFPSIRYNTVNKRRP